MQPQPKLDLHLLSVLVALLETGSVSAAALRLGVSQPAVSGSLAKLRARFNDVLFVRTAGRMTATPLGAELAGTARDILRQIDEKLCPAKVFEPSHNTRPYTIALSDVGEIVFLPRIVRELARLSPGTPVRSVSLRPAALQEALADGTVDLAIGYFPDLQSAAYFHHLLFVHHFVCLLRVDHPMTGRRLTMTEYLSLEHAVVHSEGRSQEILEQYLELHGIVRKVAVYTPHFLSIPNLIADSDMVVAVPHAVGITYGTPTHRLKTIGLPFESPRIELRQYWQSRMHKDARSVWLRGVIGNLFNASTDEWGRVPRSEERRAIVTR